MRLSTFRERMEEAFGPQASWLSRDHVFAGLGQRTVEEALAGGAEIREVWLVVHTEMRLPPALR